MVGECHRCWRKINGNGSAMSVFQEMKKKKRKKRMKRKNKKKEKWA